MAEYQYIFLKTDEEASYDPLPFYIRKLPSGIRERLAPRYIWKRAPVCREEITVSGAAGIQLTLPFSLAELKNHEAEQVHEFIERVIGREQIHNIVASQGLKKYMGALPVKEGSSLPALFLQEMLEDARRKHHISRKDLALIILDGGEAQVLPFLDERRDELNYLTIVTKREGIYEEYCEQLFQDTGLLVQMLRPEEVQNLHGNLVLDFRPERDKLYRKFPDGAVVLELTGNKDKARDMVVKRKDLSVYNKVEVFRGRESVNPGILEVSLKGPEKGPEVTENIRINCCLTLQ